MTLSRSNPRAKSRWLSLFAILLFGTAMLAGTVVAAPTFNFVADDQLANDEPGQKDLTADAAGFDAGTNDFYTAWKWDDTSWSGNNTGDACSLFDTDANGNADYAVCVTIGKPAVETSTRVYSCGDTRADRCVGSVLEGTESLDASADWCTVAGATATFPPPPTGGDTQATCNISQVVDDIANVSGLDNGTLLNSCSYPSQQPNSDPSDCVRQIANVNTSVSTSSGGSGSTALTWSATLTDSATVSNGATGSVVFTAYANATCTGTPVFTSSAQTLVNGAASTTGFTVTNLTVQNGGVYYWKVDYTPSGAFNASTSGCGEMTTINIPSAPALTVTGTTHPAAP